MELEQVFQIRTNYKQMKKKIKIGYLVNHFVPAGVETFLLNLVNNLDYSIYEPHLYILYSSTSEYINLLKKDVVIKHLDRKQAYGAVFFRKLKNELKRDNIQILHTNNWSTFFEGVLLKIQFPGLKLVYVQHGLEYYLLNNSSGPKEMIRKIIRVFGTHFYTKMISVSKIGQQLLEKEWHAKNVKVIYNGIDLKKFEEKRKVKREDLDLDESDFVICSVGRLMDVKNYMCLFKALKILNSVIPNLRLLHIGEEFKAGNTERYKLNRFIEKEGLKDNFRFLGLRHDIPQILPLCDVFSLTSFSEGISLSLLEAQAAGLPAVITNVGGNPEVVVDGYNGFLAASDDEQDVAKKILQFYNSSELRKTCAANSKLRVSEKFSLTRMVEEYQELYQKTIYNR